MTEPQLFKLPDQDVQLLRAALLDGGDAMDAFARWRAATHFEGHHEISRLRLFPLLHANLVRLGVEDPIMARLKGVHRHSWCQTQRLRHFSARAIQALREADIEVMVNKGVALGAGYYPDPSMRPMEDNDILVRPAQAERALDVLVAAGWRPYEECLSRPTTERRLFIAQRIGLSLRNSTGGNIDLHWYPIHECARAEITRRFWSRAEAVTIEGHNLVRPSPSELLFHVVVHGLRPGPSLPIYWLADATMILRTAGARIDWQGLTALARDARLAVRFDGGLRLLSDVVGLDVPLPARPPSPSLVERIEGRAHARLLASPRDPQARVLLFTANGLRFLRSENRDAAPGVAKSWLARNLVRRTAPQS